jgi:hypothetical protein
LKLALSPKKIPEPKPGRWKYIIRQQLSLSFFDFKHLKINFFFTEPRTLVGHVLIEAFEAKLAKVRAILGVVAADVNAEGPFFPFHMPNMQRTQVPRNKLPQAYLKSQNLAHVSLLIDVNRAFVLHCAIFGRGCGVAKRTQIREERHQHSYLLILPLFYQGP